MSDCKDIKADAALHIIYLPAPNALLAQDTQDIVRSKMTDQSSELQTT